MCLAVAMFFEARNQPLDGMLAVGEVILNRVEHEKFPNTVCKVVFADNAFEFTSDGKSDNMDKYSAPKDKLRKKIAIFFAEQLLAGERELNITSTHFHADSITPYWATHKDFLQDGVIGDHIFYTCTNYC